ncbi:MAG: polysaccharide biosynthesis/export family protein [Bacteroidales bacterium]|nr:polysaccharide biosynthesis/export family protein [Bacteroidales bacterium]
MIKRFIFLMAMSAVLLLSSCSSPKKFVYLQDMEPGKGYPYDSKYEAVVHCNDRLDITVSSKSPELAVPFNANSGSFQVAANGIVSEGPAVQKKGYRVDNEGNIDFPILGRIHVEGMKVSEVTELIRNLIIEGKYIKDPLVSMEFLNFRYSVLGASGAGTYTVDGDRITLLEALARSGDINQSGRVEKVAVIRQENGQQTMYVTDLRSTDLFQSPCYYLKQNDIIYVEPKNRSTGKGVQVATVTLSALSAISSILWLVLRLD